MKYPSIVKLCILIINQYQQIFHRYNLHTRIPKNPTLLGTSFVFTLNFILKVSKGTHCNFQKVNEHNYDYVSR